MKKSNSGTNELNSSDDSVKVQASPRAPINAGAGQTLTPPLSREVQEQAPVRPKNPRLQSKAPRAQHGAVLHQAATHGHGQKTSIEERVKRIQAQRAKNRAPSSFKDIVNNLAEQLKAFATTLIKGKPNVAKTSKDFPINRSIIGRMKRYGPAKVYRLKGYTTVGRVKKKRGRDMLKRHRNRLIFLIILGIFLLVLYFVIDPVPTIKQFLYDIGY